MSLKSLINEALDREIQQIIAPVLRLVQQDMGAEGEVKKRLDAVEAEAARLAASSERLTRDNPVVQDLLAALDAANGRYSRAMRGTDEQIVNSGTRAAGQWLTDTTTPTYEQLAGIGIRWNRPDPRAVLDVIEVTDNPLWAARLRALGMTPDDVDAILLRGIALGWGPTRTANELQARLPGVPAYRVAYLARTTQLNAMRRAIAYEMVANADIIQQQIRIATLDGRVCFGCLALHGTRMPVGEVVTDHPFGRCTSIVEIKGFPRRIETGAEYVQRVLAGGDPRVLALWQQTNGAALRALQAGAVTLDDFIANDGFDPLFGSFPYQRSLLNILGQRASAYYAPRP